MNSEEAEIRIALHAKIDVVIDIIDAPDGQGIVWRDDGPYDLHVITEGKCLPTTTPLPATPIDDGRWLVATLIGVVIGLGIGVVAWFVLARFIYIALGVILWLMVSSIT